MSVIACSNKTADDSKPVYNKYNNINIDENQTDDNTDSAKISESAESSGIAASTIDNILSSFHGIKSEVSTPAYDNLSINIRPDGFSCLACPDIDRNVIYYANHGKDNYIYQLKDGENTLLLDRETEYIQLWKDELYFLGYNEQADGLHSNIYKYNLNTKKLETLLEADITWMLVNENGIYFRRLYEDKCEFSSFPFDSSKIVMMQWESFLPYKDYFVVMEPESNNEFTVKLIHNTTGECILEIPSVYKKRNVSIYQDYLSFFGYDSDEAKNIMIYVINLLTGDYIAVKPDLISISELLDYTIIDNKIIYTVSKLLIEYDMDDGSLITKRVISETASSYAELYTDGKRLLAKRRVTDLHKRKTTSDIAELVIEDNQVIEKNLGQ